MNIFYIIIAIAVLLVIAVLFFLVFRNRKEAKLSPLTGLAFGCIVAGIIFGGDWLIGYGLLGAGVVLAVVDMVMKIRNDRS